MPVRDHVPVCRPQDKRVLPPRVGGLVYLPRILELGSVVLFEASLVGVGMGIVGDYKVRGLPLELGRHGHRLAVISVPYLPLSVDALHARFQDDGYAAALGLPGGGDGAVEAVVPLRQLFNMGP